MGIIDNAFNVMFLLDEYLDDNPDIKPIKKDSIEPGDIGIPQDDGTFLTYGSANDIINTERFKKWFEERSDKMKLPFKTKKRKLQEECWSLDYHIVKWLNEHLKVYLKDANDFVDLTVHRFEYHNHEYTELKLLEVLIEVTDKLLDYYDDGFVNYELKGNKLKDEMYDILKILHFTLWW